jgi:hypothetical protein
VLAPHGSLVFELGDTYAGSGGAGGDYNANGLRDGQLPFRANRGLERAESYDGGGSDHHDMAAPGTKSRLAAGRGWPLDKSLCFIPQLFGASLAYGANLLRPERTTPPWRVRNVVAWCRPNPPVGALGDKFRPATSYLTVATKSRTRYFDLDAVRTPGTPAAIGNQRNGKSRENLQGGDIGAYTAEMHAAGAPPLDYWVIPTEPYAGSHYATFPGDLCVRPIKAMCPERVCTVCGAPSRRIVGEMVKDCDRVGHGVNQWVNENGASASVVRQALTLGWTDCGHDSWRRGVVLDPFAGSGTALAVATGHGRDAIGIDLDERNAELARARVGMFLVMA